MTPRQVRNSTLDPGLVLVANDTHLPEPFRLESDSTGSGWSQVENNADVHRLEQTLDAAGWTFYYMAGTIQASAFGFNRESMMHSALQRLFKTVKKQKCNSLEIDHVATHSFLGVPYLSVSGHSRRIGEVNQ